MLTLRISFHMTFALPSNENSVVVAAESVVIIERLLPPTEAQ